MAAMAVAVRISYFSSSAAHELLAYLPSWDGVMLYADVRALRAAGVLKSLAGGAPEEDYQRFVLASGFDYTRDLDHVVASWDRGEVYLVLKGRFDAARLEKYATGEGGRCLDGMCTLAASQPGKTISFTLRGTLRGTLLRMAVSQRETAVLELGTARPPDGRSIPAERLWLTAGARVLREARPLLGDGAAQRILEKTNQVRMAAAPAAGGVELRLDVDCTDEQQAADLLGQMEAVTKLIAQAVAAGPAQGAGTILKQGRFARVRARVEARWPVDRQFLAGLGGAL